MRVCVVGLGAIGGLIAARLARSGVEVSAVARGSTLDAVRDDGLELIEGGVSSRHPVAVSSDPADLTPPDLVVLSVKATALTAVAPTVERLLGPGTAVLSATNGVPWWFFHGLPGPAGAIELPVLDPGGALAAAIPHDRVVGSVMHLAASTPAPGTVEVGYDQKVIVGEPTGPDSDGRAARVADVLSDAGFATEVSERIQRDIWFKLWGNMTMNPLSAITGATLDRILAEPGLREFASRCMREAAAIGERIGLPIDGDPEDRHRITEGLGAVKTSMLQDVEAGRPVELDALLTAPVEIGRAVGVPTPELDTLLGLARQQARSLGLYQEFPISHTSTGRRGPTLRP